MSWMDNPETRLVPCHVPSVGHMTVCKGCSETFYCRYDHPEQRLGMCRDCLSPTTYMGYLPLRFQLHPDDCGCEYHADR